MASSAAALSRTLRLSTCLTARPFRGSPAWGAALIHTIDDGGAASASGHVPAGRLNLIAELLGEHALDGDEEGTGTGEWILGASYAVSPDVELRAAATFPAWRPREFDQGVIVGLIVHF